jgi:DNA-binding transcriptional LysR family regulator
MHDIHLEKIDLNLLVTLDALLRERNVTRAAKSVGLSQSATSHALARLRVLLRDPLLVRSKGQMLLTARSEALLPLLEESLRLMRSALTNPAPFQAKTAKQAFSVGAGDFAQFIMLPPLMEKLAKRAPGIDLWVREIFSGDTIERLASGDLDMALLPKMTIPASATLRSRFLFEERFVCLVRKDHPTIKKKMSLEQYVSLPHAFIAPRGTRGGAVDDALKAMNKERRVALAVPHFLVAPYAVANSDLVITVASRVATYFAALLPVKILEPPLPLPSFQMLLIWHERLQRDPAHAWFREQIVEAAGTLDV